MDYPAQLYGLSGTVASGKDTAAEYLVKNHGFFHVSTSDIVRSEAMKRHGSVDREVLHNVANEMRCAEGAGSLCLRSVDMFLASSSNPESQGLVISGIRAVGEGKQVQTMGGKVLFVNAEPRIRYERLVSRKRVGDAIASFEDFLAFELSEASGEGPDAQNLRAVELTADHLVDGGLPLVDFYQQISSIIG